ncbi:MAG: sortase [Defluviitaleaceae bacterium]|nr:sortase [Defluviitaleaceae bacterium]
MKKKIFLLAMGFLSVLPIAKVYAIPPTPFGASDRTQGVHISHTAASSTNSFGHTTRNHHMQVHNIHNNSHININFLTEHIPYNSGQRIGTLRVERLNRSIAVFEGENMRNMDFGAGRFTSSGLNFGNLALIGHNRGSNGFFDFVRRLQEGDIIIFEGNTYTRRFEVSFERIVHESDMTPTEQFEDNRLTLITCVEYEPRYRRVAVAFEI